jgi:hypothetical protein
MDDSVYARAATLSLFAMVTRRGTPFHVAMKIIAISCVNIFPVQATFCDQVKMRPSIDAYLLGNSDVFTLIG